MRGVSFLLSNFVARLSESNNPRKHQPLNKLAWNKVKEFPSDSVLSPLVLRPSALRIQLDSESRATMEAYLNKTTIPFLPKAIPLTTKLLNVKLLTAGGFLSFFVFGFIDNLKGPLLPEVLRAERMSYSQGGTFFLAAYIGFIVATLLTGVMADVVSNRRVLLLSGICLAGGIVGLNLSKAFPLLVVFMAVIGLGLGGIEVGGNGLMVELHSVKRARYLNLLATFHGVGSLLVPLAAAWLLTYRLAWQQIYLCAGSLAGVLILLFAVVGRTELKTSLAKPNWDGAALLRIGFTWRMCWFYLLICAYVAVELGVAAWLVEYLQKVHHLSVARSSIYLSAFFVMIMLGRLVGSLLVERVGYLRMVGLSLVGTMLLLMGGLFGPADWVCLLPASGLCMSIVFPTVTAAVSSLHSSNMGSILGILFTFGGVGGALGPWLIGLASEAYGLQVGLAGTLVFCSLALLAVAVLAGSSNLPTDSKLANSPL